MTWSCEYNNDGNGGFSEWWEIIDKENDIIIAKVYTEANARLISAAPGLLEACKLCAQALKDHVQYDDGESLERDGYNAAVAAIAKTE